MFDDLMTFRMQNQVPKAIPAGTFTVKDETYELLRFPRNTKLTVEQTLTIVAGFELVDMLTATDARAMAIDPKSASAFKYFMKPGDSAHVLKLSINVTHPGSHSAILSYSITSERLGVYGYHRPWQLRLS